MDYKMCIFIQECDKKNNRLIKTRYTKPRTASTSDDNTLGSYGTNLISWVGYADDIVLVFETNDQLQAGLVTLNHTFRRLGLQINISKTKSMIFNFNKTEEEYPDVICSLEGVRLITLKCSNILNITSTLMNRWLVMESWIKGLNPRKANTTNIRRS